MLKEIGVASALLKQYQHLFNSDQGQVLDLACGKGQNGLYLRQRGINTLFADINQTALDTLMTEHNINEVNCWQADFEDTSQNDVIKLSQLQLQGMMVFRYLHRALFTAIKQAIKPGGIVIYETFTEKNKQFGRPNRAAFLLKSEELKAIFSDWEIIHYFEGMKQNPDRAIAQIVCRKPMTDDNR